MKKTARHPNPCCSLRRRSFAWARLTVTLGALACTTAWASGPPAPGGVPQPPLNQPTAPAKKPAPAAPQRQVDINSASRAELKTLPGIGEAEAERIIANRPYLSKAELVTKNVILTGPYLMLKDQVMALPKSPPRP